jgi:Ethanolamine utilization protein EutJ (predicted chaperonin)
MHQLTYYPGDGYAPIIPVSLTYNSKTFSTDVIFDTGTEPYSYIEDPTGAGTMVQLANGTGVNLTSTPGGFNYSYTTSATDNITYVENPKQSQTSITVMSLEFFLNNEYLLDYDYHKLGLKSN